MNNEYKELIDKLILIGAEKGYTKNQLAREIGIGPTAIHSFMNGRHKPSMNTLGKVMMYVKRYEKDNNE